MKLLLYMLLLRLFLTASQQTDSLVYCENDDIKGKSCNAYETSGDEKYLFYDVNPPEGFNLRRDVYMRFAIMLAEFNKQGKKQNWRLVLPPWHKLYHWKSQSSKSKPIPWSRFFDITALKSYAPVVELHEVFSKYPNKKKKLQIDLHIILQNFPDAFEGGTFKEKWEILNDDCDYVGNFWGYNNITVKETLCVRFQGKISKLWELIALHASKKNIMFSHGEIPLHDSYGTKSYWDCRKSMQFSKKLVVIAKKFMRNHLSCEAEKCDTYVSVHWRRQDFAHSRKNDVPTLPGTVSQINKFMKKNCPEITKLFVATDASSKEINQLEKDLMKLGYQVFFYMPSKSVIEEFKDGGVAIIEQIICSHGAHFLGTHESTFTFRIQEEREILGYDPDTTYNRLCPDKGKCENMSRWTIVH
ncbi:GDP-fucose protein o-fucosyltransferase domain-containing protein [Phthorimaea operculella]|nr:GDP-fucose protein o-fucosyltransferase domain-containing protein [Phthorimaea operculella]